MGSARNDVYFTADQAARVFAIARAGRDAVDLESALLEALRELEHVLPALGIEAVVFHRGRESPLIILSGTSEFLAYRRPVAARSSYERRDTSSFPPPGVVSTLAGDARVAHKVACAETLEGGALLLCIYRGADLPAPDARERALLRLGARALVSVVEHRSDTAAPGWAGAAGLTPREQRVTELVADGKTDRAIAGELGIAVDTVRTYLKRVFAKLGVRNRTEIAFRFWSSGEVGRRRTR